MSKKEISKSTYYFYGPHLDEGEEIISVVHRHPIILLKEGFIITFFGFFLPVMLWFVFPEIWAVLLIWILLAVVAVNKMLFNWYFDALLITDQSLIDVKWNGPFDRTSVRLEYNMIEGTTFAMQGIWQTLLNYGTIQVNRQGGSVGIELFDAINPSKAEATIMQYQEKFLQSKSLKDVNSLKNLLSTLISEHAKNMK